MMITSELPPCSAAKTKIDSNGKMGLRRNFNQWEKLQTVLRILASCLPTRFVRSKQPGFQPPSKFLDARAAGLLNSLS